MGLSAKSSFGSAALSAIAATALGAISLFLTLKLGFEYAGASQMGCWALVQSVMLFARLGEAGATANLVRRASLADRTGGSVENLLSAGLITAVTPVLLLGAPATIFSQWYVDQQFPGVVRADDLVIVAWGAFVIAVLTAIGLTLHSLLDGLGYQVQRHVSSILSSSALFVTALLMVPALGITGYVWSLAIQAGTQIVFALLCLAYFKALHRPPNKREIVVALRLMLLESISLTILSIVRLAFEPVSKLGMSALGDPVGLAVFDIALKITTQVRTFFQTGVQPLLRVGARQGGRLDRAQHEVFRFANNVVWKSTLAALVLQWLAAPILSIFLLERVDGALLALIGLLSIANAVNAVGMVGYYLLLSGGRNRILLGIHVVMMVVNVGLTIAGVWLGTAAVIVAAYGITFAIGGIAGSYTWWQEGRQADASGS